MRLLYIEVDSEKLVQGLTNGEQILNNQVDGKRGTDPDFGLVYCRKFNPLALEIEETPLTTFTADAGTDVLTSGAAHGLVVGDRVRVTTSGTLPAGLAVSTDYYVQAAATSTTLQLAATLGGAAIDLTSVGAGTHSLIYFPALEYLKFGAKEQGKFDADYIVSNYDGSDFAFQKSGTGSAAVYVVSPSLDNEELNTLLASGDGNEDNDEAYVDLDCEVKWKLAGKRAATVTFTLRVYNDVNKGVEAEGEGPNPEWPEPGDILRFVTAPANQDSAGGRAQVAIASPYFYVYDDAALKWIRFGPGAEVFP